MSFLRRRLVWSTSLIALLVGVPGAAVGQEPPPSGGAQDFISGGFENQFCKFGLNAHSGPNGDNPGGHMSVRCGGGIFARGPVVCADVVGNRGGFVWRIEDTNLLGQQGLFQPFWVVDNGPPGSATPDGVGSGPNVPVQPACTAIGPTGVPVLKGNIVLHDSNPAVPPLP